MFKTAFKRTMRFEGGYSNHSADRGGETYRGISRKFWPYWEGWKYIPKLKHLTHQETEELQECTEAFYKEHFWDVLKLDEISLFIPECASELFDISVNFGTKVGKKTLQRALNILNKDEKIFNDLVPDGIIGQKTIHTTEIYINKKQNEKTLLKLIRLLRAKYYIDIVEKNTSQEVFIGGWLNRVELEL